MFKVYVCVYTQKNVHTQIYILYIHIMFVCICFNNFYTKMKNKPFSLSIVT